MSIRLMGKSIDTIKPELKEDLWVLPKVLRGFGVSMSVSMGLIVAIPAGTIFNVRKI